MVGYTILIRKSSVLSLDMNATKVSNGTKSYTHHGAYRNVHFMCVDFYGLRSIFIPRSRSLIHACRSTPYLKRPQTIRESKSDPDGDQYADYGADANHRDKDHECHHSCFPSHKV